MANCPKDATQLVSTNIEDIAALQCPTCGGHWLYYGDLETLSEHHGAHAQTIAVGAHTASHATRRCPIDDSVMLQRTFADHRDLTVDQCPECRGLWLDGSELDTLMSAFDPQYVTAATANAADGSNTQPTLNQRAMLFLYQLVQHPPYI